MFPKINTTDTKSLNLRRPYSTRRGNGFQNAQFDSPQSALDYLDCHLDLSIHHPSTSFGNRFSPLSQPEASFQRDRDLYASRPHRRSRNSRGTKEAKKRRDSRRNKRKFEVHLLNEQLSQEIGETLMQYNIHPSPLSKVTPPASILPTTLAAQHIYGNGSAHVAPSAPQLPPVTLYGFSLPDFPPLIVPRPGRAPSPDPLLAGVPAWCPPIPSLTRTRAGTNELPKFYDLSCLQEPTCWPLNELNEENSQSMQLWKGTPASMPRKQSRFFPPRSTSPKPRVRLPPTGPKSRIPGAGLHDPSGAAWDAASAATEPDSITQAIERIIDAARAVSAAGKESQLPSAANLWNILAQPQQEQGERSGATNFDCTEEEANTRDSPLAVPNEQSGPFELTGNEVPYVHTNSLTGYANETATHHSEGNVLGDSAIYLVDMFASGHNANSIQELYAVSPTCSARTSTPELTESRSDPTGSDAEQYINVVVDIRAEIAKGELDDSIAHFKSEQELFVPPPSREQPCQSPSGSVCDLSTFLSMGHAEHCWCLACEEEPELVPEATVVESEASFTEDDGWMIWSNDCENTCTTAATSASSVPTDEPSSAHQRGTRSETWDESFPRKPRRARDLVQSEPDVQFLGYFDDGAAFAHADENGCEWNL